MKKKRRYGKYEMLLLSRLYSYSSDVFRVFESGVFLWDFNPEIIFTYCKKECWKYSRCNHYTWGELWQIVVETKMSDWFYEDQLLRHLNSFSDEKYKVMITLAPELMEEGKKAAFEEKAQRVQ